MNCIMSTLNRGVEEDEGETKLHLKMFFKNINPSIVLKKEEAVAVAVGGVDEEVEAAEEVDLDLVHK